MLHRRDMMLRLGQLGLGALSLPGLLLEIRRGEAMSPAGHVIACFDDTGLDAARQIARAPVVGIGEAACHVATLVAHRFTVVTTLARSVPALETNLLRYGLERLLRSAHANLYRHGYRHRVHHRQYRGWKHGDALPGLQDRPGAGGKRDDVQQDRGRGLQ